jgi:hypothetical protein
MGVTRPPLEYLATCSKVALESFELSRLGEASNLRKEVQQILQGWIDTEVDARLARWILDTKQSQARGELQAAMGQPVPLKQLDLSFLPLNGAQTSDDRMEPKAETQADAEPEENLERPNRTKMRHSAHAVLSPADGRPSEEKRSVREKKPAKLTGKPAVPAIEVAPECSAAAPPAGKPPFAQDEENALQALEHFVQCLPGASCARSANLGAAGNPRMLGDGPPMGATGGRAEVRVFPLKNAPLESMRRAHPLRAIAISARELARAAAATRS